MLLSELLKAAKINVKIEKDIEISGLAVDSRKVQAGNLFAVFTDSEETNLKYAMNAIENGAVAILTGDNTLNVNLPVFHAKNPAQAFGLMNVCFYAPLPQNLVAVTGTNGKTSTVSFIRQLWEYNNIKGASFGTLGIESKEFSEYTGWTTADSVTLNKDLNKVSALGITHVAIEASSHGLSLDRMYGLKFSAVGFTNLTQDHLDYHGNMENYFQAKMKLFTDYAKDGAVAVINADIPEFARIKAICEEKKLKVLSYGKKAEDLQLIEQNLHKTGQDITIKVLGEKHVLNLDITGAFQAMNALCALGLAIGAGMEAKTAIEAMKSLKNPDGRMELVATTPKGASIFVDYAHTPDGIENALASLRQHTKNKLWIAFGCGGNRDKTKRPIMGKFANDLADVVIVTDDNPRFEEADQIRKEIMVSIPNAIEIGDRAAAIKYAIEHAENDDVVLLAGKGHEEGQIIQGKVLPFNDRLKVLETIKNA